MPIHPSIDLQCVSNADFDLIDDAVMNCAYASQNKFGRLFDERIYENDLATRLRALGFEVHTQVPVRVTHSRFEKTYYLDLIVNHMVYELKVVAAILSEHEAQCLHYAMLHDIRRVKLINFGESKVRGKICRNALTTFERYCPTQRTSGLRIISPHCEELVGHMKELIKDWGTHLDCRLYNEALVHHFGGVERCLQRQDLHAGKLKLGTHPVQFYAPGYAFVVTAFRRQVPGYQRHLEVLIEHAALKGIQWINLNGSRLEVTTAGREDRGMGTGE